MKNRFFKFAMIGTAAVLGSCTDLKVRELDSKITTTQGGEFLGVDMPSTLDAVYNNIWESNQQNLYALNVATTDEIFIPTRGTDWGDNGVWRDLAKHTWTSGHSYDYQTWNYINRYIYLCNQILDGQTKIKAGAAWDDAWEADARLARAWNMFWVLDLWHQVPYRTAHEGPEIDPRVLTPAAAIDTIMSDLNRALDYAPTVTANSIAQQQRSSVAAVKMLMCKVLLNKHIYLGNASPAAADLTAVIDLVDDIAADGYTLQNGYFSIFSQSADSETIWWSHTQYAHRIWGGLHYNQGHDTDWGGGGWNGFSTTAEFFESFEGTDKDGNVKGGDQEERRGYVPDDGLGIGFLIGTQYDNAGVIKARSGNPLSYTKTLPGLTGNPDYTGIRLLKWHPMINMQGQTWDFHLVLFRWADAYLMKAEALLRSGDADGALTIVNDLRSVRGASALGSLTEADLLAERGRELYLEGWRRNDMIRFGKFNTNFAFVEKTDASTNVFPIPDAAMGSNPNLKQNPGY